MAIHITDLIIELRMQILSRLDGLSLFRCAITCKNLYDTYQTFSELTCIVQLYLEGLEKYDTSISSTDLLEYLRRRREKRDRPEIEYHLICIQGGAQGVGGFNSRLAGGKVDDVRRQILDLVTWNTSSSNAGREVARSSLRIPAEFMALDSTQDLMVWMEGDHLISADNFTPPRNPSPTGKIMIHTLSSNTPHPLAHSSVLEISDPFDRTAWRGSYSTIQVVNDALAFFVHLPGRKPRLTIWNWKTSNRIYDSGYVPANASIPLVDTDFTLLSPSTYLMTSALRAGSIQLYTLVSPSHSSDAISLPPNASYGSAIHLVTLHFPPTTPRVDIAQVVVEASPTEARALPNRPCKQKDSDRLHLFSTQYDIYDMREGHTIRTVTFVHQGVFMAYMEKAQSQANEAGIAITDASFKPLEVPWTEWDHETLE